ncbi:DUF368 domain-containing protein [Marinimicrobium koreense]|uniref:DUF368 domain-containing protein n=1 Tax=Marinimicrobium koreense TaxID=306545 RepID=UPI003F709D44
MTLQARLILCLKGMAMGAADVVPGVSGGTIAFISGIYEELIDSLRRWTPAALGIWRRQGTAAFWRHVNGGFLLTVFGGVLLSIFSLANLVHYLLEFHPLLVWGFFFGLVVASVVYIGRQLPLRSPVIWLGLGLGTLVALAISVGKPVQLPAEWWMVYLAGCIAICAMILPGVSGSFLLLLMGMYPVFIQAVVDLNWWILACFLAGCVTGLLLFSHFLGWLLRHYHDRTLAVLTGFLVGSLNIIWPWKHTLETYTDRHGEQVPLVQENLVPWHYENIVGSDPQTAMVLVLMALGLLLVLALEFWAKRSTH